LGIRTRLVGFHPLRQASPPAAKDPAWPRNEIDQFILARLVQEGLQPSPDAHQREWLRRVTFDVTGLPPTPTEIDDFLRDKSATASTRVVDRLLASPRYGERWGRHWLDVVRYADTAGDNSDYPIPQMYRYRDWVIQALNRDLPYDQFVRDQLAGDLTPSDSLEETHQRWIATGYLANSRRFGSRVEDYPQHLTIEDTLDNVGRAFLGLSINCARCHDHKFDPITAADYYALYGIFQSTRYPWPGIELEKRQRDLVPLVAPSEISAAEKRKQTRDQEKRRLQRIVEKLKDSLKETPKEQKTAVEEKIKEAERAAKEFAKLPLPFELVYAVAEGSNISDAAIQMKEDPAKPGEIVRRRFLSVMPGPDLPSADTTSGRAYLADAIIHRAQPLAARVMVNRIWQHHFGQGLVPTPNDFGKQGKPPTHPELLDWLANSFIRSGWSMKAVHRAILLSRVYQLSTERSETAIARDPNNVTLASYPRRRLDAESLRDTLLTLGGNLDTRPPGPHPFPPEQDWNFTQHNPFKAVYETRRRSVYLMTQRIQRHPYLALFDGADPSASTASRTTSTTPLQALYLLNDGFVHRQAQAFAQRILHEEAAEPDRFRRA